MLVGRELGDGWSGKLQRNQSPVQKKNRSKKGLLGLVKYGSASISPVMVTTPKEAVQKRKDAIIGKGTGAIQPERMNESSDCFVVASNPF